MSLFYVTADGVITVDSSNIKSEMESAYINALGANLNTETGTPEGQMITTDTKLLTYAQNQVVLVANAYNVLTATGSALDVAAAFWGYYRKSGVNTVVSATITGAAGTVIPAGSLASSGSNNFALVGEVTIPSSGSIEAQFQAVDEGAVLCEAGSLTEIVSVVSGWDTVYNNVSGAVGYLEESDNAFRQRITANWLNIRSTGELGAIMDYIAQLDGVLSCVVKENDRNETVTIDGQELISHSVYISVVGGSDDDIANAIALKKSTGIGTNGNTQIQYKSGSGLGITYNIERPEFAAIKLQVNYSRNAYTTADVTEKIKATIMQYIADKPFTIGQVISGYELARALDGFAYANLLTLKVAFASASSWSDYVDTTIAQMAVLSEDNITCAEVSDD